MRAIAIVGPTAVGKSRLGLELAERLNGEIVSVDSRQVYRGMDVGTAKANAAERSRVPHHLLDVVDPDEPYSVAVFLRDAGRVLESLRERRRLAILVGGTGYWMRALIGGETSAAVPPQPELRRQLEEIVARQGLAALRDRLARLDPLAAAAVDLENPRRLIRAIEVVESTGRPYAESKRVEPGSLADVRLIGLTLPRPQLFARIAARYDQMVRDGWTDEVRSLLARGYRRELPSMSGIGYAEMVAHVLGEMSLGDALERTTVRCRQYARSQYRWFALDDPAISWLDAQAADVDAVERLIQREAGDGTCGF